MRAVAALVLFLSAVGLAAGQAPKKPAPKVVEEGGKKVMLLAPGDSVTVDAAKYTFPPLATNKEDRGSVELVYTVSNVGPKGKSIGAADVVLGWDGWKVEGEQNEQIKSVGTLGSIRGEIWPEKEPVRWHRWFSPLPDKGVKAFVAEFKAKGGDADVWRVTYPRKTWTAKGQPPPRG